MHAGNTQKLTRAHSRIISKPCRNLIAKNCRVTWHFAMLCYPHDNHSIPHISTRVLAIPAQGAAKNRARRHSREGPFLTRAQSFFCNVSQTSLARPCTRSRKHLGQAMAPFTIILAAFLPKAFLLPSHAKASWCAPLSSPSFKLPPTCHSLNRCAWASSFAVRIPWTARQAAGFSSANRSQRRNESCNSHAATRHCAAQRKRGARCVTSPRTRRHRPRRGLPCRLRFPWRKEGLVCQRPS